MNKEDRIYPSMVIRSQSEAINSLEKENQNLKKQLEYLRSGEYYNQLRFENEMLQQVVDTNGVPSEVYDYIDCTHRNTELLEENQELKKQLEDNKNKYNTRLINQISENIEPDCEDFYLAEIEEKSNEYDKLKNQQKEFIEYINSYIELLSNKPDLIEESNKELLKEILSKYKEIIGDNDE